jgi:ferrochelatase
MKQKIVVILMNLGGPDSLNAVRPFLFNLFYDKAILNLSTPLRYLLARWISFSRNKKARGIYSLIGGKSPILENTLNQARALKKSLENDFDVLVVPAMRYWRPRTTNALEVVNAFGPSKVVLLPLYPQFSTTTTKSSIEEWQKIAPQWQSKTVIECCYFKDPDFVKAHRELIKPIFIEAKKHGAPRILFSAHGLPQKVVDDGDPYQRQIEASVVAIMQGFDGADFVICYQSKVGRLKWLTPTTEDELKKAAAQSTPVVVVPISFVSEHSETLVELDIDYAKKAKTWGIPFYGRAPALGDNPSYIKCLENSVRRLVAEKITLEPGCSAGLCRLTQAECWQQ